MAVVTEQTTEAFDWNLIVSYREVEFIETSLIAHPWYGIICAASLSNQMRYQTATRDILYYHVLTLIPACISNNINHEMWDEITYRFPNFNGNS